MQEDCAGSCRLAAPLHIATGIIFFALSILLKLFLVYLPTPKLHLVQLLETRGRKQFS